MRSDPQRLRFEIASRDRSARGRHPRGPRSAREFPLATKRRAVRLSLLAADCFAQSVHDGCGPNSLQACASVQPVVATAKAADTPRANKITTARRHAVLFIGVTPHG